MKVLLEGVDPLGIKGTVKATYNFTPIKTLPIVISPAFFNAKDEAELIILVNGYLCKCY